MSKRIIGYRLLVDGTRRLIYEDAEGQYVLNDDGERVYGLCFPSEECWRGRAVDDRTATVGSR